MSNPTLSFEARAARRNQAAFFLDYMFFGLAMTLVNPNTILPAYAARLTDSKILIGLINAVWFGGWLLPQLFAANYLSSQPKKLPHLLRAAWAGRTFFWLYALFLLAGGASIPALALAVFLIGFVVFVVTDAFGALAWFDLLGKAMPAGERGRVIGGGQAARGLLAIAAGWLVQHLLSESGPAFPYNYAAIFGLTGVFVFASLVVSYFIVEVPGEVKPSMTRWRDYLPQLTHILRHDRAFARVTAVRLLAGLHMLAIPFYVLYATQVAGQPEAAVGVYLSAQTIGTAVSGLGLGYVGARLGTRRVVQSSVMLDLVIIAIALALALSGVPQQFGWVFPVLFGMLGVVEGSRLLGYFDYVLDIAPDVERPVYIGLANSLAGLLVVMPLLGGWVLQYTSYTTLFAVTAALLVPAGVLVFTLPRPPAQAN